tara:strand:+ start:387 stop:800 length:414 start_codon:yes stop_codon:yes gene_type:complete
MTDLINGWEYVTNVVPGMVTKQTLQQEYLTAYSLAYHKFLQTICLPIDSLNLKNPGDSTKIYIDCNDDEVDPSSTYYIKFSKSRFLKSKHKKIKTDLYKHYNSNNILVKGPYELQMNTFCIDLFVNTETDTEKYSTE